MKTMKTDIKTTILLQMRINMIYKADQNEIVIIKMIIRFPL